MMDAFNVISLYGDGHSAATFVVWMLVVIALGIWIGMREDK
jgi:hypothetical protein